MLFSTYRQFCSHTPVSAVAGNFHPSDVMEAVVVHDHCEWPATQEVMVLLNGPDDSHSLTLNYWVVHLNWHQCLTAVGKDMLVFPQPLWYNMTPKSYILASAFKDRGCTGLFVISTVVGIQASFNASNALWHCRPCNFTEVGNKLKVIMC